MNWACPIDWKHIPEMKPASENMLFVLMFEDTRRWRKIRNFQFRRCNASGNWIWPLQKAWFGVVAVNTHLKYDSGAPKGGSYAVAWLNDDQFIIQKLKGII